MRLFIAALLATTAAAQDAPVPSVDRDAVAPALASSWASGASCDDEVTDFVIDTDGQPYMRSPGSYTPLTSMTLQDGYLTVIDEIGMGRSTTIFRLGGDNSLRLWSEIYEPGFGSEPEPGMAAEPAMQRVKDGLVVIDEQGAAQAGVATPEMSPCPARTAMFPADIVAALEGAWATGDEAGRICALEADSVTFQLSGPVPRVLRGPFGGEVASDAYALAIVRDGERYTLTEGSEIEGSEYTFTSDGKGGLVQANSDGEGPLKLHRCP